MATDSMKMMMSAFHARPTTFTHFVVTFFSTALLVIFDSSWAFSSTHKPNQTTTAIGDNLDVIAFMASDITPVATASREWRANSLKVAAGLTPLASTVIRGTTVPQEQRANSQHALTTAAPTNCQASDVIR